MNIGERITIECIEDTATNCEGCIFDEENSPFRIVNCYFNCDKTEHPSKKSVKFVRVEPKE